MRRNWVTAILVAAAVMFVAAAGAVRFLLGPALIQLPADLDGTATLQGTASYVDQAALQSGDLLHGLREKVPVTIHVRVRVTRAEGSTAVVDDQTTVLGPEDAVISATRNVYAVDRRTLLPAPAPAGLSVPAHEGLAVGFPLTPLPQDYPFWDAVTQSAVTAAYQRTEDVSGRQAYVYRVRSSGTVKDPETLGAAQGTPLTLTSTGDATFWVDTETSVILRVRQKQDLRAELGIPLVSVFTLDAAFSPETTQEMLTQARTAGWQVFALRTAAPLALLGLGGILGSVAAWRAARRRHRRAAASRAPEEGHHQAGQDPTIPIRYF